MTTVSKELSYVTFNTGMGWIGILGSTAGLVATTLPRSSSEQALERLGDRANHATPSPGSFTDLVRRLRIYFAGHETAFPDRLDLSAGTLFQREVWETTRLIPYRETRSYAWVASQIGRPRAARAVGQALGRNPLAIIVPCHRVIAANGNLGGFGGGLDMKKALLRLEATGTTR